MFNMEVIEELKWQLQEQVPATQFVCLVFERKEWNPPLVTTFGYEVEISQRVTYSCFWYIAKYLKPK